MAKDSDTFCLDGPSYYDILEVERGATCEDIKRSYHRLARCLHPDKSNNREDDFKDTALEKSSDNSFHQLQRAWNVLKDPQLRTKYDAALACYEHSDVLIYETLNLSDLHYNEEEQSYEYPCRCGGCYVVSKKDITRSQVIACDECSFSILVNDTFL